MDTPITKRLHISGLTPALSAEDLSRRISTFGTVLAVDGFGLQDGLGQPRKFGYITLETTTGKLTRCLNLLSGSTWKGAKLRIGEAKPDFSERLANERKKALEEPPRKKRKQYGARHAEDMSLVTPENAQERGGWKVTPLGRIMRPVRMRPEKPLPVVLDQKPTKVGKKRKPWDGDKVEEKAKKRKLKNPDSRARRRTIDMTRWGSVHLKGMFLDLEVQGVRQTKESEMDMDEVEVASEDSEGDDEDDGKATAARLDSAAARITPESGPVEPKAVEVSKSQTAATKAILPLPDDNMDVALEKNRSLNLITSLFGGKDADWEGRESVGSDIDEEELKRGDAMAGIEDASEDFEIVPIDVEPKKNTSNSTPVDEDGATEPRETKVDADPPPTERQQQKTKLKDLFAPREDEAGFSLLGHLDLDLDLELDDELPVIPPTNVRSVPQLSVPTPLPTFPSSAPSTAQIDLKRPLFFPLPQSATSSNKARPKDLFDIAKDNGWHWRDSNLGFYRTGAEEDIKKRWEDNKVELTKEWKRRWREAGKISRRRKGAGPGDDGE
ncbi:hypothetical protein BD779DRAFT_1611399 [Infundibulicybe gibba]|nr:hypothetical protein BD779DRAFT_1611399 [Infundibulicybe gibba]